MWHWQFLITEVKKLNSFFFKDILAGASIVNRFHYCNANIKSFIIWSLIKNWQYREEAISALAFVPPWSGARGSKVEWFKGFHLSLPSFTQVPHGSRHTEEDKASLSQIPQWLCHGRCTGESEGKASKHPIYLCLPSMTHPPLPLDSFTLIHLWTIRFKCPKANSWSAGSETEWNWWLAQASISSQFSNAFILPSVEAMRVSQVSFKGIRMLVKLSLESLHHFDRSSPDPNTPETSSASQKVWCGLWLMRFNKSWAIMNCPFLKFMPIPYNYLFFLTPQ